MKKFAFLALGLALVAVTNEAQAGRFFGGGACGVGMGSRMAVRAAVRGSYYDSGWVTSGPYYSSPYYSSYGSCGSCGSAPSYGSYYGGGYSSPSYYQGSPSQQGSQRVMPAPSDRPAPVRPGVPVAPAPRDF